MKRGRRPIRALVWLLACILLPAGCDQVTLPILTNPTKAIPQLPVAVALRFDEPLRAATVQQTVCDDTPWEGQLGKAIMGAFEREAQKRYARVLVGPDDKANGPPDITVDLRLVNKSFEAKTRTGATQEYTARLTVQLAATFNDANGRLLTEGPLTYHDNITIFTPMEGSSTQCRTNNLYVALDDAGDALAKQMDVIVAAIVKETRGQAVASGRPPPAQGAGALTLKGTLEDENKNQVLEAGEKITLRIDAVNEGPTPIGSATVSLSGSPSLVGAFAAALAGAPVLIGTIPSGETRTTYLAGKMPATVQDERVELTLSAVSGEGFTGNPVSLVAAARPSGSAGAVRAPAAGLSRPRAPAEATLERYAVVVSLSYYRTPWKGLRGVKGSEVKKVVALFRDSLGVPDSHILLLQDELAGRADLEEALVRWLPRRVSADSIVFFYFAGQGVSDAASGEVSLLPYDGTPSSSNIRWLSLRLLQERLKGLGARLAVAVLDAPVTPVGDAGSSKKSQSKTAQAADWRGVLDGASPNDHAGAVIQVVSSGHRDGRLSRVFDGLTGDGDGDHDGQVTLSEWLRALRGTASTYPTLPPAPSVLAIPLSAPGR